MKARRLILTRGDAEPPPAAEGSQWMTFRDLTGHVRSGKVFLWFKRYAEATLRVPRPDRSFRPGWTSALLWWLGREAFWQGDDGVRVPVRFSSLLRALATCLRDAWDIRRILREVSAEVAALSATPPKAAFKWDAISPPLYLRTDLLYGVKTGGAVGHIAGVLNHLDLSGAKPVFLTTDPIPTVRGDLETLRVDLDPGFWDFPEVPALALNRILEKPMDSALAGRKWAFVYQRNCVNNYAGARLSRKLGVPFVLEYNGSEVWTGRHWGRPLRHEALALRIESLNLTSAQLIVVVSAPLRDELVARGLEEKRVLVNPNGVDPERYHPGVDGSEVVLRHGLGGSVVVGFIGTFGRWHGSDVLVRAFHELLAKRPELGKKLRLLMIGDGATLPEAKRLARQYRIERNCVFTGMVPQADGPKYLAACDLLVAPHVPNPDGTPFFGSPTKLFEYMAMGKGIVASDLEQIGEVLEDGKTALLVKPGDAAGLAEGILRLSEDPLLRGALGREARRRALEKHTWEEHARRIVHKLQQLLV